MRRSGTEVALALAALGTAAALIWAGTGSGQPRPPDSAPGRTARRQRFGGYVVQGRTVTIAAPRSKLYGMWRDPASLAGFMENVLSAERLGEDRGAWTLRAPLGSARIEARLVEDRADEALAWRSTEASEIGFEAKVQFRDAPGDRGTEVEAHIAYQPPGGLPGHWLAKAMRRDPASQGRHELKRLKMLVETGEIATASNRKET